MAAHDALNNISLTKMWWAADLFWHGLIVVFVVVQTLPL